MGNGCRPLPRAVHRVRDPTAGHLFRQPNRRLYIGPQVQEYLAGVEVEWEERLKRWTDSRGSKRNGGRRRAARFFPAAMVSPPEETGTTLENDAYATAKSPLSLQVT